MRDQVIRAAPEEEYLAVGHLVREVMISLAQVVIDLSEAIDDDENTPSTTNAATLLDVYIGKMLPGGGNQVLRRTVRGAVKATSAVLHDRRTTPKDAALVAELVCASVHLRHILATMPNGHIE